MASGRDQSRVVGANIRKVGRISTNLTDLRVMMVAKAQIKRARAELARALEAFRAERRDDLDTAPPAFQICLEAARRQR